MHTQFVQQDQRHHSQQPLTQWQHDLAVEQDVRTLLQILRPHGLRQVAGWNEHRCVGDHFRVTVSWDDALHRAGVNEPYVIPRLADVMESILVGSARNQDELTPEAEFALYRAIVRELGQRLDSLLARCR